MISAMLRRTLIVLAFAALTGCAEIETAGTATAPAPDSAGWVMSSGRRPSKAEFTAFAATCEMKGGATDACFANLGLKKAQ